jgi:hypothetical protein
MRISSDINSFCSCNAIDLCSCSAFASASAFALTDSTSASAIAFSSALLLFPSADFFNASCALNCTADVPDGSTLFIPVISLTNFSNNFLISPGNETDFISLFSRPLIFLLIIVIISVIFLLHTSSEIQYCFF